jgi:hypothetical protein
MANELGLMNSFRDRIYGPLVQFRGTDGTAGNEIGLVDFVQKHAINENNEAVGLTNSVGEPLSWEDILQDFGIDPIQSTLDNIITLPGTDARYLAPEVVREFILRGMSSSVNYMDLVAGVESVDSLTVTAPWIQMDTNTPPIIGETETMPTTGYSWGEKSVKMKKRATAIELSDEVILSVKLPILSYWLQRFGVNLGVQLFKDAVTTLVNGDQADTSDAAATIGIGSTGSLAFSDFVRLWSRGNLIGQNWTTMVTSETMALQILALAEFKPTAGGLGQAAVTVDSRNRIIPNSLPHIISSDMDDDEILFLDPSKAMIRCQFRALLVESDRIVSRQISGTYASVMGGFLTISREARIVMDDSIAFSGNGFPSYMTPLA